MDIKLPDEYKIKVSGAEDIFKVMQHILLRDNKIDQEKEHFWIICLASSNLIVNIDLISLGTVDAPIVEPMNVFRVAVQKGAVRVILCHNHPGERLVASEADKDVTDRLIQVGRILNIEVIDHLIITTKDYMSFEYEGLMEELKKSVKWVPNYEVAEKIRREEAKIRRQAVKKALEKAAVKEAKALANRNLEIAKGLKKDGVSIEIIVKNTGLSKEEIEKLEV